MRWAESSGRGVLIRGSAGARLLCLWVRNPWRAWNFFFVNVVRCHVKVSVSGWSLFQRSPTECGVKTEGKSRTFKTRPCPRIGSKRYCKINIWNKIFLIDLDKKRKKYQATVKVLYVVNKFKAVYFMCLTKYYIAKWTCACPKLVCEKPHDYMYTLYSFRRWIESLK